MSKASQAALAQIEANLKMAEQLLRQSEQLARDHELEFSWNPFGRQEHTYAGDNWQSSDPSCWDSSEDSWQWRNSSDNC